MTRIVGCRIIAALFFASTVLLTAANAAEPVYPTGSRIGLVPPPGLTPSNKLSGFADIANKTAILLVSFPPQAYATLEKSVTPEALKKKGLIQESREAFPLAIGKAFLVISRQEIGSTKLYKWLLITATPKLTALVTVQIPEPARAKYPDAAIRAALASLTVRAHVPDDEKLSLLPFKLSERASFKVGNVVPGRAVLLSDAPDDNGKSLKKPRMVIAAAPATAAQLQDRDALARQIFSSLAGVDELLITEAGALRIDGQQGHQILASGKDAVSGTKLTIVQWLRFGSGGFLHIMGISPTKDWKQAYTRFRAVRDGIQPR